MNNKDKTDKIPDELAINEIGKEYTQKKDRLVERSKAAHSSTEKKETFENYYELKAESIDKLVNADKADLSEIDTDGHDPYKIDRLSRIPTWIKACFGKWWFAAAICFFFYWGLGTFIPNFEDLLLVLAIAMGVTTDIVLNNIFRQFQSSNKEYNKWMVFPARKLWTLFLNLIYGALLTYLVSWIYQGINLLAISLNWVNEGSVFLGVEPILFGLFFLGVDCFFLLWKNIIAKAIRVNKEKEKND